MEYSTYKQKQLRIIFRSLFINEKKAWITHEIQAYLINPNNNNYLSPLEWWRVNGKNIGVWLESCAKLVVSNGKFHSKRACVLEKWVSGYCRLVESPWSIGQKASIPLQQYLKIH